MSIKFLVFWGGILVFFGGGKYRFYFYGRGDFSDFRQNQEYSSSIKVGLQEYCWSPPHPKLYFRSEPELFSAKISEKPLNVRNFSARNSGAGNGCANLWAPGIFWFFLLEKPPCP